jgi:hypothetical protein
MLIDNEKFIALLSDNSGIEKDKVEKYLEELINEIKASFEEGEGYEVEGFGIFSKLGANILFIPSEELETEINYKYVGMEPIELPGGTTQQDSEAKEENEENPIQGIIDAGVTEGVEEYEDPFAELFNEAEEYEKSKQDEESSDLTEDEIEAVVEEEIESEGEPEEEILSESFLEENTEETEDDLEESLKNIFDEDEPEDESLEEETAPGPETWGIDAHKEEEQEGVFSGLLGDDTEDTELIDENDIFATEDELTETEDVFETEEESSPEVSNEPEESEEDTDEEIDFSALEDDEDFDDPFGDLEEEVEEDFVPVVTNVSSGKASKKKEESVVESTDSVKENKGTKKSKTPKSPRDRKQSAPVFLYMILTLILLGGTGYLLAYFGVVNIEGITPNSAPAQIVQNTPPANQPESTPPQTIGGEEEQPVRNVPESGNDVTTDNADDMSSQDESTVENTPQTTTENTNNQTTPVEEREIAPLRADEKAPGDMGIITPSINQENTETYGLNGNATTEGNNGYTIVLYTLSRKSGADSQYEKLTNDGFRVIIKEKPSTQFGTLYRVSIGQFKTLADAAIAAEKVDSDILGNYIITKI